MKKNIEELCEIFHPSLEKIKNFLDAHEWNSEDFLGTTNLTIYKDTSSERLKKDYVVELKNSHVSVIFPSDIINEIENFLNFLKTNYEIEIVWLMVYTPKSHLSFHIDPDSNRHLIPLNENERFFNYESKKQDYSHVQLYNNKLKEFENNIDEFNEFFIQDDPKINKIVNLKTNKIYIFNNSLHNFYNGSNKLRANLVFEVKNCKIEKTVS